MSVLPRQPDPEALGRRLGRALEGLLVILAVAVFAILWAYVAAAVLTDGALLQDTWAWLTSLGIVETIVVWLAILPIGVWLWAWQADLEPLLMGLVIVGLVGWTFIALSGLPRLRRGRSR